MWLRTGHLKLCYVGLWVITSYVSFWKEKPETHTKTADLSVCSSLFLFTMFKPVEIINHLLQDQKWGRFRTPCTGLFSILTVLFLINFFYFTCTVLYGLSFVQVLSQYYNSFMNCWQLKLLWISGGSRFLLCLFNLFTEEGARYEETELKTASSVILEISKASQHIYSLLGDMGNEEDMDTDLQHSLW